MFKNLVIIPKQKFQEWKNYEQQTQNLTDLDQNIIKIVMNKSLTDFEKWNLYKFQLKKFKDKRPAPQPKYHDKLYSELRKEPKRENKSMSTQTKIPEEIVRVNRSVQTKDFVPKKLVQLNQSMQTEDFNNKEDIFEFDGKQDTNELFENKFNDSEEMEFDPQDIEFELHKIAQDQFGAPRSSDVRKVAASGNIRTFTDLRTNEFLSIPVEAARQSLEKSVQPEIKQNFIPSSLYIEADDEESVQSDMPRPVLIRKRNKKIYPKTHTYQTRKLINEAVGRKAAAEIAVAKKGGKKQEVAWQEVK